MARFKWIMAAMFLVLGQAALAADDIEDDDTLTPTQKEQLKKVQENLALVTKDSKQTKGEKEAALADSLRKVLVQNSNPSDMSVNKLAGNLAGNIGAGNMDVRDSLLLTKTLMRFLNDGDFSFDSTRNLVNKVQGLVQTSNLSQDDRNQLYNAVLTVVSTADGFKRNGK